MGSYTKKLKKQESSFLCATRLLGMIHIPTINYQSICEKYGSYGTYNPKP